MAQAKRYGQGESPAGAGAMTASTSAALDAASPFAALLPYYLVAVAAGVTVWFVTRWLSKRSKRSDR